MHSIILTPHPLKANALVGALRRDNIHSIVCSPKSLSFGWQPDTDALIFPDELEKEDWDFLKEYLDTLSLDTPLIFFEKKQRKVFLQKEFRAFLERCIFIDHELSLDQFPNLVKESVHKKIENPESKYLKVGDLVLDRHQRLIQVGDRKERLTKKEFFLLELLMLNNGQVTTRESIIDYVWDRRHFVAQNTIDVYISRLRKKLDPVSKPKLIRTIPSLGYEFSN